MPKKPSLWLLITFGLLLLLAVLLLIPATQQALSPGLGFADPTEPPLSYNGFDAFIPFIPGYFPEDFQITYADTGSLTTATLSTYTETYASETRFFVTIQSQGQAVPEVQPDPGFTIQNQPAVLTNEFDLAQLAAENNLDLSQFANQEAWLLQVILKDISVQLVTNLPKAEAVRVAEGLIPSICTSPPTPEG